MLCGRAAIPRGAHPAVEATPPWEERAGQPGDRLCFPGAHAGAAVLVREAPLLGLPKASCQETSAAVSGQARCQAQLSAAASPRHEQQQGSAEEQTAWAAARLPSDAPGPTPACARHEHLRLASWESW